MISGWTILASLVWVAVGVVIGLLTAALLIGARRDKDTGEADDMEADDD